MIATKDGPRAGEEERAAVAASECAAIGRDTEWAGGGWSGPVSERSGIKLFLQHKGGTQDFGR